MANWKENIIEELIAEGLNVVVKPYGFKVEETKYFLYDIREKSQCNSSQTIHIHEDFYRTRKHQVIERVLAISGKFKRRVHGRKTKVATITKKQARSFLNQNHLIGFGGGKTFYGLYENDDLIAVAVFSKIRWMKYENPPYYSAELERFCSQSGLRVTGGLDKLIQHYFKHHKADDLVTYADKEWTDGAVYYRLGFEKIGETPPLTFSIDPTTFKRRLYNHPEQKKDAWKVNNLGNLKFRRKR